ncbi:MAG: tRNA (adenosine(37)-N6)-threonylcarbamoyltransferase complex dimerization subunit type 1 TsaB [Psychroflexus halocasei]
MAKILCLETATKNCSVSLGDKDLLIDVKELSSQGYSHAEQLHPFVDDILKEAGLSIQDLDAISISKGPGSYTGLRIGVSAAKGFAYAAQLPLISVSTLACLALQVKDIPDDALIIPMLDARRMEVYTQTFDAQHRELTEIEAKILDETSFKEQLKNQPVYFIGDGVEKFEEICKHPNAHFIKEKLPSAREQFYIARQKFLSSSFEDVAYFEPFYLKDFRPG